MIIYREKSGLWVSTVARDADCIRAEESKWRKVIYVDEYSSESLDKAAMIEAMEILHQKGARLDTDRRHRLSKYIALRTRRRLRDKPKARG